MPFLLRRLFLLLLLFAATLPGKSQTPPSPAVPAASAASAAPLLTRADTARAIHELFRSRRGGGTAWLAVGTAGILASTLPAQQTTSAGVWTPGVVAGSALLAIGLNKRIQFRRGRERRILRELAVTGHLPFSVERRLRGNFAPLHGTASQDNPLLAENVVPGAAAGGTPITSPVAPTPAQLLADARQDTLDAVQGLFNARRLAGQLPILLALPGLRLMTGSNTTNKSAPAYGQAQSNEPSTVQVAAGLLLATGGVVFMFIHNAPYSDAKFAQLRNSYLAGSPLPPAIRTKLKPNHVAAGRAYRERMERKAARRKR